jgi:hypothetical protein
MRHKTLDNLTVRAAPGALPEITISTDSVDRMKDRVKQEGLTFPDRLPVLFGHDYYQLPVGVSGRALIARGPHVTRARWNWIAGDAQADAVKNAFEQGALSASVGMHVGAAEPNDVGGYDITSAEVVEFSLVSVPANQDCVRLLKQLGWTARAKPECPGIGRLKCPNDNNSADCPAESACPLAGHAHASLPWRRSEPGLTLLDDAPERGLALEPEYAVSPDVARAAIREYLRGEAGKALSGAEGERLDIGMTKDELAAVVRAVVRGGVSREIDRMRGRILDP